MIHELRLAVRRLQKAPLYSWSVCVALSLTGAALMAAGVVAYAVLIAPLPYEDPEELVFIERRSLGTDGGNGPFAPADYLDFRAQSTTLETVAATEAWRPVLAGDQAAERLTGLRVSGDLFKLLGVPAALGRTIEASDDRAGAEQVAVISRRLWLRLFGGDPAALGQSLRLDGVSFTVLGVMPGGFEFPTFWHTGADIWAPFQWPAERAASRNASSLRVFARLALGATMGQAQAEVYTINESLRAAFPATNADRGVRALGIRDATVRGVRPVLLALAAGAALLWLIALANVSVLAVVRATGQTTETAVRRALGESWSAGFRRGVMEGALLAVAGSAMGAVVGFWAIQLVSASAPPELGLIVSRWEDLPMGGIAAIATVAPALAATVVLALAGRWAFARGHLIDSLRARTEAGASRRSTSARTLLTGGQIALAVVLTAAAGLVGKSLLALLAVNPGFDPERVTTAVISVTGSTFGDPARKAGFYRSLLDRLQQAPGIESAAAVNHVPLVGDHWGFGFYIEGQEPPQPGSEPNAAYRVATPGYFRTIGARLIAGRDFAITDHSEAPLVIVVNQTFVERHLAGRDRPIGTRVRVGGDDKPWRQIVGVVADLQQRSWTDVGAEIFLPFEQEEAFRESPRSHFSMTVALRSAVGAGPAGPLLRRLVADLDPTIPVDRMITLEEAVAGALWQPRLTASLMGVFALIALILAGIGVYGTTAQAVAARRTELGLRMALGATRQQILALTLGRNLRFVVGGIVAGIALAWLLSDLLRDLLYQVRAQDGFVFAAACGVFGLTGLLATYIPARRAAATDPAMALRSE